ARAAEIGADIDRDRGAEGEKTAVPIERQLGFGDLMPAMHVGGDRFAALGGPFDRPAELCRGPDRENFLGVDLTLHAERAADIEGANPDARLRNTEDLRDRLAHAERILSRRAQ